MVWGFLLLVVALICDGITGPRQDQVLSQKPKLNGLVIMLIMNIFASIWSGIAFLLFEQFHAFLFCYHYPQTWKYIAWFAIASALGQFCIFGCLKLMGSLHLAFVTTVRKFFSIVLSIFFYRHNVDIIQWLCIVSIFSSLTIQTLYSNRAKQQKAQTTHKQNYITTTTTQTDTKKLL